MKSPPSGPGGSSHHIVRLFLLLGKALAIKMTIAVDQLIILKIAARRLVMLLIKRMAIPAMVEEHRLDRCDTDILTREIYNA